MEKLKVMLEAQYNGHSVKKNGSVDLSFKIPYSNLMDCVKLLQLLSVNIAMKASNMPIIILCLIIYYSNVGILKSIILIISSLVKVWEPTLSGCQVL